MALSRPLTTEPKQTVLALRRLSWFTMWTIHRELFGETILVSERTALYHTYLRSSLLDHAQSCALRYFRRPNMPRTVLYVIPVPKA